MNKNQIITDSWSNDLTAALYKERWPAEPALRVQAEEDCLQCGGCAFFAPFNADWGLCCHPGSRHHLETVFEHFTCPVYEGEGWGPHSFTKNKEHHCRCGGAGSEYWDRVVAALAPWRLKPAGGDAPSDAK